MSACMHACTSKHRSVSVLIEEDEPVEVDERESRNYASQLILT